jgi:hypothetical protein
MGGNRLSSNGQQHMRTCFDSFATGLSSVQPAHVGYAAEGGSELSYRDATRMTLMTETVATDRPPLAKRRSPTSTVSASALALHLDCSRANVGKLEAEGVIQRQGDNFPLDQNRVFYLRYLRR